MRLAVTILLGVLYVSGYTQDLNSFLIMDYSFDNCSFEDSAALHDDLTANNPSCQCGVGDLGLEFTQPNQEVFLPTSINSFLSQDFTLSFYLQVRNTGNATPIWSLSKNNSVDSTMSIRYLPNVEMLSVQLSESASTFIEIAVPLDITRCWNHFVLTRQGPDYYVYINGVLEGQRGSSRALSFYMDTTVVIASNSSLSQGNDFFRGRIDKIQLFNRFSGATDVNILYERPDQILNQDTVLFLGDNLQINMSPSCASNIQWTPSGGVSNTTDLEPIMTPSESTTYTVQLTDSFCTVEDTIRINVVNSDELNCQGLLLPKAFTPNGDGLNDTYYISNGFIVEDLISFEIYDRWGQKIFETQSKSGEWDGTYKDERLNPGMYVYKISYICLGEEYSVADNFSLIR